MELIDKIIDYNYGEFGTEFGDALVDLKNENIRLNNIINKAIEYIRSEYTITDDDVYLALYSSDGTLDKLESIFKGDNK